MAVFRSSVLTKKGNELLIDAVAGENIIFTRMLTGCGEYTDEERDRRTLEKRESLKNAKQEFTFSSYKKESEQSVRLTAIISNRGLVKSYKITEIGIYGKKSGDAEDFLCSVAITNSTEESDTFPPFNGLQECQIVQDYYITISPDAEVNIVTKGASVLIEDFLEKIAELENGCRTKMEELKNKIEELKRSFQTGVNKIYNYLKGLGFTPATNSPDEICVSIQMIYDTRYTNGYNAGRLQGQEDVKLNPGEYGISTGIAEEQFTMYTSSRVFGDILNNLTAPHSGTCFLKFELYLTYDSHSKANKGKVYVNRNGVNVAYADIEDDGFDIHPDISDDEGTHQYIWKKTLEIPNCTSGETLEYKIVRDGANASWIIGLY